MAKPEDYGSIGFAIRRGKGDEPDTYESINPNEIVAVFQNTAKPSRHDEQRAESDETFGKDVEIIDDPNIPGDRTTLIISPGQMIPLTRKDMAQGFGDIKRIGKCVVRKITEDDLKFLAAKSGAIGGTHSWNDHLPDGHPMKVKTTKQTDGSPGSPNAEADIGFPDDPALMEQSSAVAE